MPSTLREITTTLDVEVEIFFGEEEPRQKAYGPQSADELLDAVRVEDRGLVVQAPRKFHRLFDSLTYEEALALQGGYEEASALHEGC